MPPRSRRARDRGRSERRGHGTAALAVALVGVDRLALLQAEGDVVEAVEQTVLDVGVDVEAGGAPRPTDLLLGEVDLSLLGLGDRAHVLDRQLDWEQADLGAVRAEDVGEARRDDGAEAVVLEGPGRVLAARAAAEVAPGDEDLVARQVPIGLLGPVVEEELAEARALHALEELLGDDLVGVDVVAVENRDRPGDRLDGLHSVTSAGHPAPRSELGDRRSAARDRSNRGCRRSGPRWR